MALNNVDLPTLGSPTKPIDKDTAPTLPVGIGPDFAVVDFERLAEIRSSVGPKPGLDQRSLRVIRRVCLRC